MPFVDGMSVIRRDGNAGLVTTTGGGAGFEDTLHTLPAGRSARITKITAYNNIGGNVPLLIGTMDRNPLGAAFVQLLTTIIAINAIESVWLKEELPEIEFISDNTLTAAGRTGDIVVQDAGAGGVLLTIEVEEKV